MVLAAATVAADAAAATLHHQRLYLVLPTDEVALQLTIVVRTLSAVPPAHNIL
jgi:hypothetical protein